jgi:hypothetical protein
MSRFFITKLNSHSKGGYADIWKAERRVINRYGLEVSEVSFAYVQLALNTESSAIVRADACGKSHTPHQPRLGKA